MTEPITFTFTQLLAFGTFLFALIGVVAKIGWSVWRIKRNALEGLLKKDDFSKFTAKYNREMGQLQADVKNMKADIASFETRFHTHINEKKK